MRFFAQKLKPALDAYAAKEVMPTLEEVFEEHKLPAEFASKVIEGVPTLAWGGGRDCTFAGALEAASEVTEHPCSYCDTMGFSALAFRVRWHEGWYPSCTVGEMDEEIMSVAKATGWQLEVKADKGGVDMEQFAADIVAHVNAGRPVLAYPPPDMNVGVVYGYDDGGKTLLVRDYMKGDAETKFVTRELGFLLIFLGEHVDPAPAEVAVSEALRQAVHNWQRSIGHEGPSDYSYGERALNQWMNDLARADGLTDDERRKLFFLSWLNFTTVADIMERDGAAIASIETALAAVD